jgi:hypothetical protein
MLLWLLRCGCCRWCCWLLVPLWLLLLVLLLLVLPLPMPLAQAQALVQM